MLSLGLLVCSCGHIQKEPGGVGVTRFIVTKSPYKNLDPTPPEVVGTGCIVTDECAQDENGRPVLTVVCPAKPTGD